MTKIDIISGFLGAGKTTLIKKLLKDGFQNEKLVLIENEFGEIGIDGGFLKDAGIQITEMNSGCICCSLVGDFSKALNEVLVKYHPDRIVIEPSGVGKLSDVIGAVSKVLNEDVILNSASVVVDVKKCRMYMKNFGEFFNNQIESAKTIILSRTQNVTQDKLLACEKLLREHNEKATIITTPWEELSGELIVSAMEEKTTFAEDVMKEVAKEQEHEHHHEHEDCCHDHEHHEHEDCCHDHEHAHHHADEVFESFGIETGRKFEKEELNGMLKELSEAEDIGFILRAKGIVPAADGTWLNFDFVPGEYEVREGNSDVTGKLCVIGSKIDMEKVKKIFHL